MPTDRQFRTRLAPSPTGYLHLGFLRQLIFARLFATINNGVCYLRLEDTDRNRLNPDSGVAFVKNLNEIGLNPDEGINGEQKGAKDDFYGIYQYGEFGPYIQSERLDIYHLHAQNLIDRQLAYWNYLTPDERQELQDIKKATKQPINYFKINQEKFESADLFKSVSDGLNDPRKPVLTYRLQRQGKIKCTDLLVGETEFDLSLEEDFGILKSDGFPTYHLAHLVDDYLMQTSLVLRAQEWYPSISKHATMYRDYWGELPFDYLHAPFILGETGNKKMSKRDGNVNIQYYLDQGYLPEAIINYLAFLGWNPGTDKELYLDQSDFVDIKDPLLRVQKLIDNLALDFSIEKLSKSPARFNQEKLNWFNRQYISMMSLEEYVARSFEHKKEMRDYITDQSYIAYNLDKNRVTTLAEIGAESDCVLNWQKPDQNDLKWKKISIEESLANLREITPVVINISGELKNERELLKNSVSAFYLNEKFMVIAANVEAKIKHWLTENQKDTGSYLWPLRVALSGKLRSPSPFELLAILDTQEVQSRLEQCLG